MAEPIVDTTAPDETPEPRRSRAIGRVAISVLVTFGGLAALSWETLWQLEAALSLGVSAFGAALTLATTMAGMTAGSLLMGRFLERRALARPAALYGLLELAIGLLGLAMRPGFRWVEAWDTQAYAWSPAAAPWIHVLGIAGVLGLPSMAMGATIPVFERIAERYGTPVSRLYGLNTLGAAVGTLAVAFFLVPRFGVAGAVMAAAGVNGVVAAAAFAMPRGAAATAPATAAAAATTGLDLRGAGLVVLVTGFATFALEVVWFRSLLAAFQNTSESFAIMLASVLLPLAVGANLAPWLRRVGAQPAWLLGLAAVAILLATPLVERVDLLAPHRLYRPDTLYLGLLAQWFGLSLAVVGPPMLLIGTALPLYLDAATTPTRVARLYAINTVGAVLGASLGSWLLIPSLGVARSSWLVGALVLGVAVALARRRPRLAVALGGAGLAGLAVAMVWTSSLGRDRIQTSHTSLGEYEIVAFEEGPDATVSVVEPEDGQRRLLIDGFIATTERQDHSHYMAWMGRLPMLLHPAPRRALVIAFGTGQTAAAVLDEGPEHLDVVELSPAVLSVAGHFASNRGVLDDPRVRTTLMDGRAWVRRVDEVYDVVTLEPMPPYFAGVNSLYCREFYELVAQRLSPKGVVAQWLPFHLVTVEHAQAITRTFVASFPDALLWIDPKGGTGILLGRRTPGRRWLGTFWPGLRRPGANRSLPPEQIRRSATLGSLALHRYGEAGRIIDDSNQLLAYSLGRGQLVAGPSDNTFEANMQEVIHWGQSPLNRPEGRAPPPAALRP